MATKLSTAVKAALALMAQAVAAKGQSDSFAGTAFELCRKGIAAYDASGDIGATIKGKARMVALREWAEDIEGVKATMPDYIAKITAAYAVPGIEAKIETKSKNPSVRTVDVNSAKSKGDFAKLAEAARISMKLTRAKGTKKKGADKKADAAKAKALKEATDKAIEKAVKEATGDGTSFYRSIVAVLTAGSAQSYLLPNLKEALAECGYEMVRASASKTVEHGVPEAPAKKAPALIPATPGSAMQAALDKALSARKVNGKAQSASM